MVPSAIRPACHFCGELLFAGSPVTAAVSSHLFLPVSNLFFLSVSSHICLSVSVSLTLAVGGILPTSHCLILFLSYGQSYLLSVTEVMTMVESAYSSLIYSLPNSTALSLSFCLSSPQVQSLVSHELCSGMALYLSVSGVMTSLSVQPRNSFW